MHTARLVALGVGLLGVASTARGCPPFITDDPGIADGVLELNFIGTYQRLPDGVVNATVPMLEINPILEPGIFQLEVAVPAALSDEPDRGVRAGLGDATLGFKWRFWPASDDGFVGMSIAPKLTVPTGSVSRSLGAGGWAVTLPVQAGWEFGPDNRFWAFAEAGLTHDTRLSLGSGTTALCGACVGSVLVPGSLEAGIEIACTRLIDDPGRTGAIVNFGVIHTPGAGIQLFGAIGRTLLDDDGPSPLLTLGLQLVF